MATSPDSGAEQFHRDRREHGGIPAHLDDDRLAELTEEERVAHGIDPYDAMEVPPATDAPVPTDITDSAEYQEERAEIEREEAEGELQPGPDGFPPTRYDES
ncbi:MAG TPA: hypothetical protein VMV92_44195 [Streptosporangiaceae bacterium]|nr:hypothetical protein [Streptosporangiaceae bacterium]